MKPNWSSAPEWANYASQELSGTWYWHAERPRYQELTGEWISKGQRQIVPKVTLRAQDTLESRPFDPNWKGMAQITKDLEALGAHQE